MGRTLFFQAATGRFRAHEPSDPKIAAVCQEAPGVALIDLGFEGVVRGGEAVKDCRACGAADDAAVKLDQAVHRLGVAVERGIGLARG